MDATVCMERAPENLESWIEANRSRLVGIAQAILRDRAEAEDVVQDTLLKAWHRSSVQDIPNWGGYVSRAVYWNALKRRPASRADTQSLREEMARAPTCDPPSSQVRDEEPGLLS